MPLQSRFALVSRRAVLNGAGAAAVLGLAGCTDDRSVLASGNRSAASATGSVRPEAPATPGATVTTVPLGVPSGAPPMTIEFTYRATTEAGPAGRGGGPVRNPFIVVWIEDEAGNLVKTVSLWHLQHSAGWLNELRRWYQASGGQDTPSSATRPAGSYQVAWDLTDLTGARVTAPTAYVCVEAAREHGPYSIVRQRVSLVKAGTVPLGAQGELTGVTVTVAG